MDQRKIRSYWFWVLACALAGPVCVGDSVEDSVRQRLNEIKSDDAQASQIAEMELIVMGEKAIEPLRKIIDSGAPQRETAGRMYLAVLEKTGLITRVTLNFDNAPMKEIIADLNRQAGKEVVWLDSTLNKERVTIHREKVPFTLALAELCDAVDGAVFSDIIKSKGVLGKSAGSRRRPIAEEFGVVTLINGIQWNSEFYYGGHPMQAFIPSKGPRETRFMIDLHLLEDPKRQALFTQFRDVEALDQKGNKFEKDNLNSMGVSSSQSGLVNNFSLSLDPSPEATKFSHLRGKMVRYVGYDLETWEIGDPAKAQGITHKFGATQVEIRKVTVSATQCSIEGVWTGVPVSASDPKREHNRWVLDSIARWFSAEGDASNSVSKNIFSGTLDVTATAGTYGGTFKVGWRTSDKAGFKDIRIKATVPRKFMDLTSAFEFKDFELP